MKGRVICVAGPTAAGKTRLAVELALLLGGEVVSADSMQVYRGMDIGTAKATPEETRGVKHHMLDRADPSEAYSVARYVEEASECVDGILASGRVPVICGGTGLYIDSLIKGLDFCPAGQGTPLRAELNALAEREGPAAVYALLLERDAEAAARLHPNDARRVIRALEARELGGAGIGGHNAETAARPPAYDALRIVLSFTDRAELYRRIDLRVDKMLENGLLDETRRLLASGVPGSATAMQAIGYKEILPVLSGETDVFSASAAIKQATRRYAKRQLTWFRRWESAKWIFQEKNASFDEVLRVSTEFLKDFGVQSSQK